jgi:hypothetical protein
MTIVIPEIYHDSPLAKKSPAVAAGLSRRAKHVLTALPLSDLFQPRPRLPSIPALLKLRLGLI